MSKPRKKSSRKAKCPEAKTTETTTSAIPDEAYRSFVRNLLTRGEAVPAGQELPPGATHEIVTDGKDGTPKVVRKRFSAF
jgi:hypothetical protein